MLPPESTKFEDHLLGFTTWQVDKEPRQVDNYKVTSTGPTVKPKVDTPSSQMHIVKNG